MEPEDRDRDENSGRFTETWTAEEVLTALEDEGGEATTTVIAQRIGSSYDTAHNKLHALEGDDEITSLRVGNSLLWRTNA